MTSESTTRWPVLDERRPLAPAPLSSGGRRLPRSAWLLTSLAFICGGLVSAAGFSIGWRHQAQRDTATQTALAAAAARTHALEQRTAALLASLGATRRAKAREHAAAAALQRTAAAHGAKAAAAAATASHAARSISSGAGSLNSSATRIASELKTLDTYLTATPTGELDPGYIANQTAYLAQQLTRLQDGAGGLGGSLASFETAVHKLNRETAALRQH